MSFEIKDSVLKKYRKEPGVTNIVIPNSVKGIGDNAFYGCTGLTSITIPDSVTSIGESAFEDCDSLTSITIGNSVTSIGAWAFYDCSRLTSISIPDSVTSIGDSAFSYCRSLTSIDIPDSVTSIGVDAFEGCNSLTIYGNCRSYAERYAKDRGIAFLTATKVISKYELKAQPVIYLKLLPNETKKLAVNRLKNLLENAGVDILDCSLHKNIELREVQQ